MKKLKLYLNYAGHCLGKENEAISGGRRQKIKFHALWGLIEHPEKGWILYDTGYTQRFYEATSRFPNKIYAMVTKVVATGAEEVQAQLKNAGISPLDIQHIIITHFHADHVAGLLDFPNATFYASRKALDYTLGLSSLFAFSKGVLKGLLPPNLTTRTILVDEACNKLEDSVFGYKYDLFGDGAVYVYDLPGHAAGQIGVMLETDRQKYFLIADACWLKQSYEDYVLPHPITKLFFHSWTDFGQTLKKIQEYHQANPNTVIVPTHCTETTQALVQDKLDLDVL